jgi:hypothetical protein
MMINLVAKIRRVRTYQTTEKLSSDNFETGQQKDGEGKVDRMVFGGDEQGS